MQGVVDTHAFMTALLVSAERFGCTLVYNTAVVGGAVRPDSGQPIIVHTTQVRSVACAAYPLKSVVAHVSTNSQGSFACEHFVNAAGLYSPFLMRSFQGYPAGLVPLAYFAKGSYFKVTSKYGCSVESCAGYSCDYS